MAYDRLPDHAPGETLWTLPELPTVAELTGHHVTDDPRQVVAALQGGVPLDRGRGIDEAAIEDLKANGLYISPYANLWMGRSERKWNFAPRLTPAERTAIAEAMLRQGRLTDPGYLTDWERGQVLRHLERFTEGGDVDSLRELARQPYNFASWKPSFLAPLGIMNDELPYIVPVRAAGTFPI